MPLAQRAFVNIRIISSLNDEDEDRLASTVLSAMDELLLQMPIAYSVRIETTAGNVLQRSRGGEDRDVTSNQDQDQIIVKGVAARDLSRPAGRTLRPGLVSGRGTAR